MPKVRSTSEPHIISRRTRICYLDHKSGVISIIIIIIISKLHRAHLTCRRSCPRSAQLLIPLRGCQMLQRSNPPTDPPPPPPPPPATRVTVPRGVSRLCCWCRRCCALLVPHCLRRLSPHGIGGVGVNARRVGGNLWAATSRISGKEEHVGRKEKKNPGSFYSS